jgi:hypothetical protein
MLSEKELDEKYSGLEKIYANICVSAGALQVYEDHGLYSYHVENIRGNQVCFQGVITVNEDRKQNWHDMLKIFGEGYSDRFPVELFIGKTEGSIVELIIRGKKIIVTCKQMHSGYDEPFENALYEKTKSFGGCCSSKYFDPPLKKKSQREMLISTHEKYSKSLGFEIINQMFFQFAKMFIQIISYEQEYACHMDHRMNHNGTTYETSEIFVPEYKLTVVWKKTNNNKDLVGIFQDDEPNLKCEINFGKDKKVYQAKNIKETKIEKKFIEKCLRYLDIEKEKNELEKYLSEFTTQIFASSRK